MIFTHTADKSIVIDDLTISLNQFLELEVNYALPEPAIRRFYDQGSVNLLSDGERSWTESEVWEEGDFYLSRLEAYRKVVREKERKALLFSSPAPQVDTEPAEVIPLPPSPPLTQERKEELLLESFAQAPDTVEPNSGSYETLEFLCRSYYLLDVADRPQFLEEKPQFAALEDIDLWGLLRLRRYNLLASSDWTQLADAPLSSSQRELWTSYRKDLRDLPEQSSDPHLVVMPQLGTSIPESK